MLILALDTSSPAGSIALLNDGRLIAEWTVGNAGTHSNWLMKAIDTLLATSGFSVKDIGLYPLTIGPGSFTGLRIGISTVKGLAWPLGKMTAGVSTLKALALNLRYSESTVCPVLDARKGEVYSALYRFEGGELKTILPDANLKPEELFRAISEKVSGPVIFSGSGLSVYGGLISSSVKEAVFAPEPLWLVRASNVALLALSMGEEGYVSAAQLAPVYLRKSEAELKEKAR